MDDKKICFITCVDDEVQYNESLLYIKNLNIPDDYGIDTISVKDADSVASAYNRAMKSTDAKYKVYLHQDTYIINKNFIYDMLKTFDKNEDIGIIGVVGAKCMPTSGIWTESRHKYGQVYDSHTGDMELASFNTSDDDVYVDAVDGLIMITQYDVTWREDIFNGWCFYDLSQCVEFSMKGYKIIVPNQEKPWCIHDCGFLNKNNKYDEYRKNFLDEYSKNIFPLVSILIPTHNRPEYFKIALESAIKQTYRNVEIIVCDDSDDETTYKLIQPYLNRYNNIIYDFERGRDGGKNWKKCLELCRGEYINFLMDDDVFHIDKINRMINYYIQYPNVSLVTSYRQVIDKDGIRMSPTYSTRKLYEKDTIVSGKTIGKIVLLNVLNFIGEPTTVLYRRKYYRELVLYCNNEIINCNLDIARSLLALKDGDCIYISDPLSNFRIHEGQSLSDTKIIILATLEWHSIIFEYYKNSNFYDSEKEFIQSLLKWVQLATMRLMYFRSSDKVYANKLFNMLSNAIGIILNVNN
ncbi:glycosyltransferase [Clostridium sp. LBM24168]